MIQHSLLLSVSLSLNQREARHVTTQRDQLASVAVSFAISLLLSKYQLHTFMQPGRNRGFPDLRVHEQLEC